MDKYLASDNLLWLAHFRCSTNVHPIELAPPQKDASSFQLESGIPVIMIHSILNQSLSKIISIPN